MKRIITTVGTSIFTNLIKKGGSNVEEHYEFLEDADYSKWNSEKDSIDLLRKAVNKELRGEKGDSAEIESIIAIANDLEEDVDVYLLATDTVVSRLACELVKTWFEGRGREITIHFNPENDVVSLSSLKDRLTTLILAGTTIDVSGAPRAWIPPLCHQAWEKGGIVFSLEREEEDFQIPVREKGDWGGMFSTFGKVD